MVYGLPRREVMGKEAPSAPTSNHVEDNVKDLAQGMDSRATWGLGDRQMGLKHLPLGVGEIE